MSNVSLTLANERKAQQWATHACPMPSSVCQSKLIFSFRACFIHRPFKSIETISESLCFWVTVPISTLTNIFSHGSAHGAVNLTIVFFDWGRYPNRFWSFTGLGSLPQLILIHFLNRVVTLINSGTFRTRVPILVDLGIFISNLHCT